MKRLAPALLAAGLALPAAASASEALVEYQALKPEYAIRMAQTAMEACRDGGFQVGVAVVDRFGNLQVFMRDRFAGTHTIETATRKAWTAVSFRTNTSDLDKSTRPDTEAGGIRFISQALPLGGGLMVQAGGQLVAGIGVSGAPGPDLDDECAKAGIAAIQDDLDF